MNDMNAAESSIIEAGAERPLLFRPPGGYYNDMVIQAAKQKGIPLSFGHGIRIHATGLLQVYRLSLTKC